MMFVMSVLKSIGVSVILMPTLARSSRMKFAMLTRSALLLFVFSDEAHLIAARILEEPVAVRVLEAEAGEQLLRLGRVVVVA